MEPAPGGESWTLGIDIASNSDFDGKPAFKLVLQKVGEHWNFNVARLWHQGWDWSWS